MSILALTSDTLSSPAAVGQIEYTSPIFAATPIGTQRGIVPTQQYYRLDSAVVGTQVLTAQSVFGVGVTLSSSTVYEFEMVVAFSKTTGTTSHTFNLGIGGTATFNNITTNLTGANNNASLTPATNSANNVFQLTTTATISAMTSAIVLAVTNHWFVIKGTVSINAGGTFIPQYTLSAAPGGAYSTVAGSFIKINPLSASGAATNVGTWA